MEEENNRPCSKDSPDVPDGIAIDYVDASTPQSFSNPSAPNFASSVAEAMNRHRQSFYNGNFRSYGNAPPPVMLAGAISYPGYMLVAPAYVADPASYDVAVTEAMKSCLRLTDYSEEALSEVSSALDTLANYRVLSRLYWLGYGMYGPPHGGYYGLRMPLPAITAPGEIAERDQNQELDDMNRLGERQRVSESEESDPDNEIYYINRYGKVHVETVREERPLNRDIFNFNRSGRNELNQVPDEERLTLSKEEYEFFSLNETNPSRVDTDLTVDINSHNDIFHVPDDDHLLQPFHSELNGAGIALPVNNNSFGLGTGPNAYPYCLGNNRSEIESREQMIVAITREIIQEGTNCYLEIPEYLFKLTFGLEGELLSSVEDRCNVLIIIYRRRRYTRGYLKRHVAITGVPSFVGEAQDMIMGILERKLEHTNQRPVYVETTGLREFFRD